MRLAWILLGLVPAARALAQEPGPEPPPVPVEAPPPVVLTVPAPVVVEKTVVVEPPPADPRVGFRFGSYGRISAATDLRGGTPEPVAVVAHPPRVVEGSYVELELRHGLVVDDWLLRTVITPALAGEPFHYTGDFDSSELALRNLYAEAGRDAWAFWVGSRMWRGDDVYLLDWWPLDNLNLVGGGVSYAASSFSLRFAAGANRLLDPFQSQVVSTADGFFGADAIEQLDRQRLVAALRGEYRPVERVAVVAYAELQGLPAGERERAGDELEELPRDWGAVFGLEAKYFGFGRRDGHATLFLRSGHGLAAADWLGVPGAVGPDRTTWGRARDLTLGTSLNYELGPGGVLFGGYVRRFTSAAPDAATDFWSGDELVADVRPFFTLVGPLAAAVDLSISRRWPNGLSPSELAVVQPTVVQLAPMLLLTPGGPGSYARPQLRLVYRAAHLDDDARAEYAPDDPRRDHAWVHYLGLQAEWWFDSSYN